MKAKGTFENHGKKLMVEAILRSALCGIAIGFAAVFVAALVLWFTPVRSLWICVGAFATVSVIASLICFFAKFRPTDFTNARRLDRLGLEERLITMVENPNDTSFIATLQRNDAKSALARLDVKKIKIIIPRVIIVSLAVCGVLGIGMTVVNALSDTGVLPGGDEIIDSVIKEQEIEYVSVSYVIEEGGIIEGDEEQIIVKGTDAGTVTAVADEGFVFKEWSDGYASPTRTDRELLEDVIYTAIFTELEDGEGEGEEGDGEGDEGDQPEDAPKDPQEGDGNQDQSQGEPNPDSSTGGGSVSDPANKIVNNEEYYRDVIERMNDETGDRLDDNTEGYTQEEIELIKKYLGIV